MNFLFVISKMAKTTTKTPLEKYQCKRAFNLIAKKESVATASFVPI